MMVEERLPSLLREDGLRNNDLMVWLGVIRTLLEVEAVVRVGYRGIRVCLEEVDLTILGGEENVNKIKSRDVFDIAPHSCSTYPKPPTQAFLATTEPIGQVPTQSQIHNDHSRRIGQISIHVYECPVAVCTCKVIS